MNRGETLSSVLRHEMAVVSRCRGLRIGVLVYVLALTVWALGWGDGAANGARAIETILLAICLPWIGARCASPERGNDLIMSSTFRGLSASRVVLARAAAVGSALAVVVLSGLPIVILANRISAGPAVEVLRDLAAQGALAIVATAAVLTARYLWPGRVQGWLVAATVTVGVATMVRIPSGSAVVLATAAASGGLVVGILASRADATLRFVPGDRR
jgi:hypothetical protein